jgi:hypothetical protein
MSFLGLPSPQVAPPPPQITAPDRIKNVAQTLGYDKDWIIQPLNNQQWEEWRRHVPDSSVTDGAFSLLGTGRTYLQQSWLDKHPNDDDLQKKLAHELGHMTLNTVDESKANKWASEKLKALKPKLSGKLSEMSR